MARKNLHLQQFRNNSWLGRIYVSNISGTTYDSEEFRTQKVCVFNIPGTYYGSEEFMFSKISETIYDSKKVVSPTFSEHFMTWNNLCIQQFLIGTPYGSEEFASSIFPEQLMIRTTSRLQNFKITYDSDKFALPKISERFMTQTSLLL